MKVNTILWILRVWALIIGSSVFPCIQVLIAIRRMEGRFFRYMAFDYWSRTFEAALLVIIFMVLPAETAGPNHTIPISWSPILVLILFWMLDRVVKSVSVWLTAMHVAFGVLNGHKPKAAAAGDGK